MLARTQILILIATLFSTRIEGRSLLVTRGDQLAGDIDWGSPEQMNYDPQINYHHRTRPDAIVQILAEGPRVDQYEYEYEDQGLDEDQGIEEIGPEVVDLDSILLEQSAPTTSILQPDSPEQEYQNSCAQEPGCRWECEPRHDDLPPDCDCICLYSDAKWDKLP